MKRLTQKTDYCTAFCRMEDRKECAYWTGCVELKCGDARIYDRLAAYEDTGLEPEQIHALQVHPDHAYVDHVKQLFPIMDRLEELAEAEQLGGLVTLPFAPGVTLVDHSDPERPELLKNFRLAVAYDHNGIVFHQPLGIFLENVQRGYIAQVSEEAERALEGGNGGGS